MWMTQMIINYWSKDSWPNWSRSKVRRSQWLYCRRSSIAFQSNVQATVLLFIYNIILQPTYRHMMRHAGRLTDQWTLFIIIASTVYGHSKRTGLPALPWNPNNLACISSVCWLKSSFLLELRRSRWTGHVSHYEIDLLLDPIRSEPCRGVASCRPAKEAYNGILIVIGHWLFPFCDDSAF